MKLFYFAFFSFFISLLSCKNESGTKQPSENSIEPISIRIQKANDLLWLQGSWVSEDKSTVESWAVQGDSLSGNVYSASANKIIEVLSIKQIGKSWVYVSKALDSELGKSIVLDLEKYSSGKISFNNPIYEYPNKVEYALENEKLIRVTISGKGQSPKFYKMIKLD